MTSEQVFLIFGAGYTLGLFGGAMVMWLVRKIKESRP